MLIMDSHSSFFVSMRTFNVSDHTLLALIKVFEYVKCSVQS